MNMLGYCMEYVEAAYLKVIHINFNDDSFEIYKSDIEAPKVSTFTEWVATFIAENMVYKEDVEKFKDFVSVDKWKDWIAKTDKGCYCSYRRKNGNGDYIHVSICVIRDKKRAGYGILFVKDINSIYETEYECILDNLGVTDNFTQLLNRYAYQKDIAKFKGGNVGVMFADLNGLKYVNDTKGHVAGDRLILEFSNLLKRAFADYKIYHISGDEFIVIAFDTSLRSFLQRVLGWHRWVWENGEYPIASVGYSLDADVTNIAELVKEAENAMYVDKDIFYSRYPKYKRK